MVSGYPTPSHYVTTKRFLDSPYTLEFEDGLLLVDCISGSVLVNMKSAVGLWGRTLTVKKIDGTRNPVSVYPVSGQSIDSFPLFQIFDRNHAVSFTSDGFNWWAE